MSIINFHEITQFIIIIKNIICKYSGWKAVMKNLSV
jgi:hypothetical protein